MRGVLILATGHPNYGTYANQLCMSIKASDPDIKIALAYNGLSLSHVGKPLWDNKIIIDDELIKTNGLPDHVKAKLHIYELSPFETTMYIDADVIWHPGRKISALFDELEQYNFTMSNRSVEEIGKAKDTHLHWAKPSSLMNKYKFKEDKKLYNMASEFIYFKKSPEIEWFFNEAIAVHEDQPEIQKKFAHNMPDELAFEIASIKTGIEPHKSPFIPFYWEEFERRNLVVSEMYKQYWAFSIGGNSIQSQPKNIYNNLAGVYNRAFGLDGYFPARDKREWLPERVTL